MRWHCADIEERYIQFFFLCWLYKQLPRLISDLASGLRWRWNHLHLQNTSSVDPNTFQAPTRHRQLRLHIEWSTFLWTELVQLRAHISKSTLKDNYFTKQAKSFLEEMAQFGLANMSPNIQHAIQLSSVETAKNADPMVQSDPLFKWLHIHSVSPGFTRMWRAELVFRTLMNFDELWTWSILKYPEVIWQFQRRCLWAARAFQCVFVHVCSKLHQLCSDKTVNVRSPIQQKTLVADWLVMFVALQSQLWLSVALSTLSITRDSRCKILLAMALPESQEAARVMLQTMLSEHMTSGHKWVQTYYKHVQTIHGKAKVFQSVQLRPSAISSCCQESQLSNLAEIVTAGQPITERKASESAPDSSLHNSPRCLCVCVSFRIHLCHSSCVLVPSRPLPWRLSCEQKLNALRQVSWQSHNLRYLQHEHQWASYIIPVSPGNDETYRWPRVEEPTCCWSPWAKRCQT